MTQASYPENCEKLEKLMQKAGISSLEELSRISGVSRWQLIRLEYGLLPKMSIEFLVKLSVSLQVPLNELVSLFYTDGAVFQSETEKSALEQEIAQLKALQKDYQNLQEEIETLQHKYQNFQQEKQQEIELLQQNYQNLQQEKQREIEALQVDYQNLQQEKQQEIEALQQNYQNLQREKQQEIEALQWDYQNLQQETEKEKETLTREYQKLQQTLEQQRENLTQEFQRSSLQLLESWLIQWPTAALAAQRNPKLQAIKLLPLLKPVVNLLKHWGVEAIASVGEQVPYNPRCHELMEGTAEPGDLVKVRYVGYRQGDHLLYRAKVSLVPPSQAEAPEKQVETKDIKIVSATDTVFDPPIESD